MFRTSASGGPLDGFEVDIISSGGTVKATIHGRLPTLFPWYPEVSVAGSRVFYLDGDSQLKALEATGHVTDITRLPGGPSDRIVFSVDPVTGRIAYAKATVDPTTCPSPPAGPPCYPRVTTTLFVAEPTGSNPRPLPVHRIPIGWRAGRIVVGSAAGYIQNEGQVNPYLARSLALVDPGDGSVTEIGGKCTEPDGSLTGPLSASGMACVHQLSSISAIQWDGSERIIYSGPLQPGSFPAALSPDGAQVAVSVQGELYVSSAQRGLIDAGVRAVPYGWLDVDHLLASTSSAQASPTGYVVVDVRSGQSTPVLPTLPTGFVPPFGAYFSSFPAHA